jgi:hypothetical protein
LAPNKDVVAVLPPNAKPPEEVVAVVAPKGAVDVDVPPKMDPVVPKTIGKLQNFLIPGSEVKNNYDSKRVYQLTGIS